MIELLIKNLITGRFTSFSVGLARPLAHSSVFVEDQTGRASNLVELTIRAEEELVADLGSRIFFFFFYKLQCLNPDRWR